MVFENQFDKKLRFRKWHIVSFKDVSSKQEFIDKVCGAKSVKYAIVGKEFAPTTNEMHFHAYFEFEHACTMASIKKILPTSHIEDAHGTAAQNRTYITKEDKDAVEIGTPVCQSFGVQDIANNVLQYMYNNPSMNLLNLALDMPEFSDYIIKNYTTLHKIDNDIKEMSQQVIISKQEYQALQNMIAVDNMQENEETIMQNVGGVVKENNQDIDLPFPIQQELPY